MSCRSSISRADTRVPAARVPAAWGSSNRALADLALSSLLLIWLPVLRAHQHHTSGSAPSTPPGTGHLLHCRVALWYSGLSGSSLRGHVSRTLTRRSRGRDHPAILRRAGRTTRWKQTKLLTGLPGRPNTIMGLVPPPWAGTCSVAKVRGLPGFILTRPKCTVPLRSSRGLIRSRSPMETPPEVTSTSTPSRIALSSAPSRCPSVSRAIPRSVTLAPPLIAAATSMERFASRIWPGPSGEVPGSTTSSPVDSTPTWGLPYTLSWVAPTVARMPTSATPTTSPCSRTVAPVMMSEPTGRMS
mmetsp:Transcript_32455/g.71688  ORF Transcript_32455/g.71688 Transcript_32455/m.71688 type:complete len:300 (-) Transcript_32455:476-1375(-)